MQCYLEMFVLLQHAGPDVEGFGVNGFGHVMSAASVDLQCCQIFSYKYHCL